jgi:large subunit ribosomal protein L4
MRLNALRSVLAQKHRDGKVVCLADLAVEEPKTAALEKQLVGKLKLSEKTLLVPLDHEPNLELAARNNPRLNVVRALGVSVVDLLDCETLVISESALKRLSEVLAP